MIINNTEKPKEYSIKYVSSHMASILLFDNNCLFDVYSIARTSGVKAISKTSKISDPVIDTTTSSLIITLAEWSTAILISFNSATIQTK